MVTARHIKENKMKKNPNRYRLSRVELDDETKRLLREFAKREGVSMSKSLHTLIAQYRKVGK